MPSHYQVVRTHSTQYILLLAISKKKTSSYKFTLMFIVGEAVFAVLAGSRAFYIRKTKITKWDINSPIASYFKSLRREFIVVN